MRLSYILCFTFITYYSVAQVTTDPAFPQADKPVTFTVDVSGTPLEGYNNPIWIWTWIKDGCSGNCDATTNVNPATSAQDAALMTRSEDDPDVYSITFTPTEFFNKSAEDFEVLGLLLKGRDWGDGQTPDYLVTIYKGDFEVSISSPAAGDVFKSVGEPVTIEAAASEQADLFLYMNDNLIKEEPDATTISYEFIPDQPGRFEFYVVADNGTTQNADTAYIIVPEETLSEARPKDIIAGINYNETDPSSVILDLWAPFKESVYVIGDFTGWEILPEYRMKKDGEHFWLEITGLEAGKEYGFQYLVDEEIYIADPFADIVLDPDDQYISSSVYPDLMQYPAEALQNNWYFNRISVLQTGQQEYEWESEPLYPAKDSLIIYELLIRDFFADGERTYTNLTDTLSYLKELGINAVQLMPVMEFNGNLSWGYNPTFMFAPDKYYGSKNELKAFIDEAHKMNMAVILDIAMNHNDIPNSFLAMYFDYSNFKPTADNPFFNVDATHPFNVFSDFNHESTYTQKYLDTINHYWLNEYKVDGFRYDLSKGFTQNDYGDDVNAWSSYDASRVALLKRMKNEIDEYAPEALLILEHFGNNTEETELSKEGFLLWGNANYQYSQAAMGYSSGASILSAYYENRNWQDASLVSYMESHDEERLAYRVKEYGNTSGNYNTKDQEEMIQRLKAAAAFLYTLPGPKMMWQWEEWGYDVSIDYNDRTGIKPVPFDNVDGLDYNNSPDRQELYTFYKALLNLRRDYPNVFSFGDADVRENSNVLLKQIVIRNSNFTVNPTSPEEMNAVVIGNFDVQRRTFPVVFPHSGTWYNYFSYTGNITTTTTSMNITLDPGEFRLLTDVELEKPADLVTAISTSPAEFIYYPNPVTDQLRILNAGAGKASFYNQLGRIVFEVGISEGENMVSLENLPNGIYLVKLTSSQSSETFKIVKN